MDREQNAKAYIVSAKEKQGGYAGGLFFELAKKVIERGGLVIGAAYLEDFSVGHIAVDELGRLEKLVGVKYAESHISESIIQKIQDNVQEGRCVLFAGTPCQIEQMCRYMGEKWQNFYTVAIGCPGVIRENVWKDYIQRVQVNGSVITEIHYPYKEGFGVSQNKTMIRFSHGTAYLRDEKQDSLLQLRDAGYVYREQCYQCPGDRGQADIFLEKYYQEGIKDKTQEDGITRAITYTNKGKRLLDSIAARLYIEKESGFSPKGNFSLLKKPEDYRDFWKNYADYGFSVSLGCVLEKLCDRFKKESIFEMLRQYVELDSKGYSIEKILEDWRLDRFILFGTSKANWIFAKKMKDSGRVSAVIDDSTDQEILKKQMDQIADSDLPIVVTSVCFMPDVIEKMKRWEINKKRLLSLSFLISEEYSWRILNGPGHGTWNKKNGGLENIFLITGAAFNNKGAQAMLFTAVSEMKRRCPDADIYYLPVDSVSTYPDSVLKQFRFHIIRTGRHIYGHLYNLLPQLTAMIDISGYALTSKGDVDPYVHNLLLAKRYDIPIYLMPQSFGPLDFPPGTDARVREGLRHVKVIFAREKKGYDVLVGKYGLNNVVYTNDMVLQNKHLLTEHIYASPLLIKSYALAGRNNVAVIPNKRNYEFCSRENVLAIYRTIIESLLEKGKTVYIVRHCDDDQICKDIMAGFPNHRNIVLYGYDLSCLEFRAFVKKFQYIVASRYHAVIHAYKENIPCIAVGWAEKYKELLQQFGQAGYGFDVRENIDRKRLMETVSHLDEHWKEEKKTIRKKLHKVQEENCFDRVEV